MESIRILELKHDVIADDNAVAAEIRSRLKADHTFLLNLMSSPGAGKTSLLLRTIEALKGDLRIGVLEADVDSVVDAEKIATTGVTAIQLHTGGACHMDAPTTKQGLDEIGTAGFDLIALENVGNLICPAEVDTGASLSAMILSVPEGDDKPLKYPLMFTKVEAVVINKIDCLSYFDFDLIRVTERIRRLNPSAEIFPVSAKTGEGIPAWADWLKKRAAVWNG